MLLTHEPLVIHIEGMINNSLSNTSFYGELKMKCYLPVEDVIDILYKIHIFEGNLYCVPLDTKDIEATELTFIEFKLTFIDKKIDIKEPEINTRNWYSFFQSDKRFRASTFSLSSQFIYEGSNSILKDWSQ